MKKTVSVFLVFVLLACYVSLGTAYAEDNSKVASFVERCYSLILGRSADEDGLKNWVNQLASNTATAAEIVNGFMESQEYTNKNNSSEQTVSILYDTMLDRPADEVGKKNWVGVLNASGSNAVVINGFCGSQEFQTLCSDYGITAGSVPEFVEPVIEPVPGLIGFIERCYRQALNRNSDDNGRDYWTNILESKEQTPKQVASGFVFSQEMADRNLNNSEIVDMFYRLYLGREPDSAGRATWIYAMDNGMTLEELNDGFADSQEFHNIVESYGLYDGEYIGNYNSMIFHRMDCSTVSRMSAKNKIILETRQEALERGFRPCEICDP